MSTGGADSSQAPPGFHETQLLEELELSDGTLSLAVGETIFPQSIAFPEEQVQDLPELPLLVGDTSGTAALTPGEIVGRGGMSVVRSAQQHALRREVVVKELRGDHRGREDAWRLVREALVTGALGHPAIIPVHLLGIDESGSPIMVMERVGGSGWEEELEQDNEARGRDAFLDKHLRVLIHVCNAVGFAHSRGLIHRDIKPQNVMLGAFGEVFLLDWGLAAALPNAPAELAQLLGSEAGLAGTPCYMAPEMVSAERAQVGITTDVYLLGGVLHRILTGRPPHPGGNILTTLHHVRTSTGFAAGDLPGPRPLCELTSRALSPDPRARPTSALAFQTELEDYLSHRASSQLAERGWEQLIEVEKLRTLPIEAEQRKRFSRFFGSCEFSFREALQSWEDNPQARAGMEQLRIVGFEQALDTGELEMAATLLGFLENKPHLEERLEKALEQAAAQRSRHEELEQLAHDLDVQVGAAVRGTVALSAGLLWGFTPIGLAMIRYQGRIELDHVDHLGLSMISLVAAAAAIWVLRHSLFQNEISRRIVASVLVAFAGMSMLRVGAWLLGLSMGATMALMMGVMSIVLWMMVITLDRRLAQVAALYMVGAAVAAIRPDIAYWASGVTNLAGGVLVAMVWVWGDVAQGRDASGAGRV